MEYKCGSCREVSVLSPKSKFCPICGSSSLILVVKEQVEPAQRETVGVYDTTTSDASTFSKVETFGEFTETEPSIQKEEEDRPRLKR